MKTLKTPFYLQPVLFFSLTFLLSWLVWVPLALAHFEVGPLRIAEGTSNIVRLLGVLMPAGTALLLAGRDGRREIGARLRLWRVGWQWWFAVVVVQPGLLVISGLVFNLFGEPKVALTVLQSPVEVIVNLFFLLIATLGEEIGWRGAALPGLQLRNSAIKSSAILGVLWAVWHVPFWMLMDSFDQFGVPYLFLNFLFVFLGTFYITWFFNHSRQSILLPVGFHFAFNIVNTVLLPVTLNIGAYGVFIALEFLLVLALLPRLEPE